MPNSEEQCRAWLIGLLYEDNPVDVEDVKRWANEMGFTEGELKVARRELKVLTVNNAAKGCTASGRYWLLNPEVD